ncbi:hypothetical protein CIK05_12115 [Bdellovibrio sp. qaytius]|nr:hypothetical protein CIK05_12115 [Bdellovibrio sp. qaytius]
METTSDIKNQFNSKAEKFGEKASHAAEKIGDKATHAVDRARRAGEEFLETPISERMTDAFSGLRTRSADAYDTSIASVRRNPAAWLGAAVGVGVLAGLFFGRRRS